MYTHLFLFLIEFHLINNPFYPIFSLTLNAKDPILW